MVCSFGLVAKWLQGQYYYAGTACPKFIAGPKDIKEEDFGDMEIELHSGFEYASF